jgi:hypothetical protein
MKTTEAAEVSRWEHTEMKSRDAIPRSALRPKATVRIPQIPMEWMDPMSWRLPSGKALAEFALQAGFLAPLMLGNPGVKRRKPAARIAAAVDKQTGEGAERSGGFRETR